MSLYAAPFESSVSLDADPALLGPTARLSSLAALVLADDAADEKYLIGKGDQDVDEYEKFARENAKDIIACGFDIERTFIFSDYGYMGGDFYRNITRVAKRITRANADSCFGFTAGTNVGKVQLEYEE